MANISLTRYWYLKKYIGPHDHIIKTWCENSFLLENNQDISVAENKLKFCFPNSLKEFWLAIGSGNLTTPENPPDSYSCAHNNVILSPTEIADMILDIREKGEETEAVLPEVYEYIEEGYIDIKNNDFIFFEIGDSSSFLVMKPNSAYPNGVYDMIGRLIEPEFEDFIYKLYHVSPDYYLHLDNDLPNEKELTEEEKLIGTPPRGEIWGYINKNYHKRLRELGWYEEFKYGGETSAKQMMSRLKGEVFLNYCPNCGNLKLTPMARQCLKCQKFIDPVR